MNVHDKFMHRCFDLALLAGKQVKTNPNVGSVLVHNNKIISEGYYEKYGGDHAERNAINRLDDRSLLPKSILYVSLEPCNIHGKTPPCSDLLISSGVKHVVISVNDPNPKIDGGSIKLLRSHGIKVEEGILIEEGRRIIAPFTAQLNQRPFIILKWAQSSDAYFGKRDEQVWISNQYSKVLSHKWRTEIDAILVGFNTALIDNPQLTSRRYEGENPVRVVLDKNLSIPKTHHLWLDEHPTLFINNQKNNTIGNKHCILIEKDDNFRRNLLHQLYKLGLYRLMIEGGVKTIMGFYNEGLWDEARIIKSDRALGSGIRAPLIKGRKFNAIKLDSDIVEYIENQ